MNPGRTVFAQLISFLSHNEFNRCVARYEGNKHVRQFSCWNQFLTMAFAQLTYRESLREIEVGLHAHRSKLYHCGFHGSIKRSTLADANETRDWRIYADFAQSLIRIARPLYVDTDLGLELAATAYALDATTIDLCLSLFPWARFRRAKGGIKLHTLLEIHSEIPVFIAITEALMHDVNLLDFILLQPGSFLVMDRAYVDFARLYRLHRAAAFFVIRSKDNLSFRRRYSHFADRSVGIRSDQTVVLIGPKSSRLYPDVLRRISFHSPETDQRLVLLTNNFSIPALTVASLYRYRWQIELFFKWIKQHLRIKKFFGTSINSVKTQIWIAVSVYVLVAIIKKRLGLGLSLYTILQILSLTLFEKKPLLQVFDDFHDHFKMLDNANQLKLFDI